MSDIIYDDFLNPEPEDNASTIGMSHTRPVEKLKTETVPDELVDRLGAVTNVTAIGGAGIVKSTDNPMMVNTYVDGPTGTVNGLGTDYDTAPEPLYEDDVIGDVMDSTDLTALEDLVSSFHTALEAMQYTEPDSTKLDPNQPVDLALLMNEVEYADDGVYRANERVEYLSDMRNEIVAIGGVSQDQIVAYESVYPQVITANIALETFTQIPTRTNYRKVVTSLEDMIAAASIAGLTLTIYAIAKIIKWLIKKVKDFKYGSKTDADRGQFMDRLDRLNKHVKITEDKFANAYANNDKFWGFVKDHIDDSFQSQQLPVTTINTIFQDSYFERVTSGKYCPFNDMLYSQDATHIAKHISAVTNNFLVSLNSHFDKISQLGWDRTIDPATLLLDFDSLTDLASTLDTTTGKDTHETILNIQDRIRVLTTAYGKDKHPPKFSESVDKIQFKLDGSFDIDDRQVSRMHRMGTNIKRWEQELNKIQDPDIRADRAEIYKTTLSNIKLVAALVASIVTLHDSTADYFMAMGQTIVKTETLWRQAFKIANVNYGG